MENKQEMHQKLALVVVLLCGALLVMLNATLLSPALPTIMVDFGVSATTVQWLTSAYTLTEAVVIPLSAYLLGRFTTRRLFFFGIGVFILFSFVAAIAPSFPVLLVARALQAVGSGVVMPMTVTLIMLTFPREKRGTAMGLVTLVIGFAPAVGPTVGGILVDNIGYRALFLVITVLGLLVLLFGSKFVTNHEGFEGYALDVPSVVLMMCGMVCLLYGISYCTSAANVAIPVALIIVGAVLLAVFAKRQLSLEKPMLKLTTLKSRKFRLNIIVVMVIQAAMIGGSVILPLYVQDSLGYSATVSGLLILPGAVIGAIIGFFSGKIYDRYGVRGLTVTGITIFAIGAIGMATFALDTSIAYIVLFFTIFSFSAQMIMTPMNTWGVNSLPNELIQHANSLSNSLNQVAGSIGTALLTALTALGPAFAPQGSALEQTCMGHHIAFIGLATLAVIAALLIYTCVREKKTDKVMEAETQAAQPAVAESGALPEEDEISRSWTVAEAMDAEPKYVYSDRKVGEVFDLFADTETDGVPVIDHDRTVVGYLSDGDVLGYFARQDITFSGMAANMYRIVDDERIQDTMATLFDLDVTSLATKKAITLDAGTSLERACAVFSERKLKKAPVVEDGKLVGSLSRRNIIGFIAEKSNRAGEKAAGDEGESA